MWAHLGRPLRALDSAARDGRVCAHITAAEGKGGESYDSPTSPRLFCLAAGGLRIGTRRSELVESLKPIASA